MYHSHNNPDQKSLQNQTHNQTDRQYISQFSSKKRHFDQTINFETVSIVLHHLKGGSFLLYDFRLNRQDFLFFVFKFVLFNIQKILRHSKILTNIRKKRGIDQILWMFMQSWHFSLQSSLFWRLEVMFEECPLKVGVWCLSDRFVSFRALVTVRLVSIVMVRLGLPVYHT